MTKSTQIDNFDMTNGLGTISFSPKLISDIIKNVLSSFEGYSYIAHTIKPVQHNYYEVSICIKTPEKTLDYKTIDKMQKEFLIVMKQSLSLSCVVVLNIDNE